MAKNSAIAILENSCTNTNILAGTSVKLHGTRLGCPAADMKGNGPSMVDDTKCMSNNNGANSRINEAIDNNSKPRMTLLQGGENGEPMAGQNNSGSYSLDVKNDSIISSNIIFRGSVLRQIEEKRKPRRYIYIGTVRVEITELLPN